MKSFIKKIFKSKYYFYSFCFALFILLYLTQNNLSNSVNSVIFYLSPAIENNRWLAYSWISSIVLSSIFIAVYVFQNRLIFSFRSWFIGVLIAVFYFVNRVSPDSKIEFWRVLNSELRYFDLLIIPLIATFSWKIRCLLRKKNKNEESSLSDDPLTEEDFDDYELKDDVIALCEEVKKYNKSGVVNFGIEGEWGSGKSSFMNMMRIVLEGEKDNIIIKFNPWKSNSSDQIVEDFFQTLSEKLPVVDLSGKVKRYGRLLSKVSGNSLLTTILNFCFSSPSLDKSYRSVENIIGRLNRKVIVFVDDIDRMDGKEVMAVFKLLRNTGDFPNTSYIVAYDQKHITAQIDKYWEFASGSSNSSEDTTAKEQDTRASFFIDKIIQVEYQMPRNKQEKPLEWLLSEVKKIVSSENQEFRGIIENRYRSHFKDQIGTYRIAKRILSRFILEKNMIGEYGNLDQLFLVDIIKVIMPSYFKEKVKRYRNEKDYKEKNIVYQHREKEADSTPESKMFYACIIDKSSMDLEYKKRLYFFLDKDGLSTIDKYNLKNKSFEELMDIFHKTEKSERDKRLIRRFYSLIKLDIFNDVDYAKVVLKQYIKELFYIKNDLENIDSVSEGVCRGTKADLDKNEHKEFIKWLVSPLNFGIDGIKIGEGIINKDEYLSNTVQEILRENMKNYVRSDAAVLEYIRSYKKKHNLLAVGQ